LLKNLILSSGWLKAKSCLKFKTQLLKAKKLLQKSENQQLKAKKLLQKSENQQLKAKKSCCKIIKMLMKKLRLKRLNKLQFFFAFFIEV